jgi:putative salt-induced outer membrane protein
MTSKWMVLGALAMALASAGAQAQWKVKVALGASSTGGNTENETVNGAFDVEYTRDKWVQTFSGSGNYGSDDSTTTAQRWELRTQSSYKFSEKTYAFGAGRYEDDRFSTFSYQATAAGGLGYKFVDTEKMKFFVQAGPGYRWAEVATTGQTQDQFIGRGDLGFEYAFTESAKIIEHLLVEAGSDNTYLQNDLALEVNVYKSIGLRLAYQVRYNTETEPGVEGTDTLFVVGLTYELK